MKILQDWMQRRRLRRYAREAIHHARHLRNMREDLMGAEERRRLDAAMAEVAAAEAQRDWPAIEKKGDRLLQCVSDLTPARSSPGLRENIEVLVVAIAVAMAFRTYFLQPFKIPTGSMQPTLYGIQVRPDVAPTLMDRFPLKLAKWLITGDWYVEVRAKASGIVGEGTRRRDTGDVVVEIAGKLHTVPAVDGLRVGQGMYVTQGQVLWAGIRTAGDHLLVNRIAWNFRRPSRGDIIVFNTDGILGLVQNTHYIKRLAGLPGETLAIQPPNLIINGVKVTEPWPIRRVESCEPGSGYDGYQFATFKPPNSPLCVLLSAADKVTLGDKEYFALGDNTRNSADSRYWGPVPQANLVGPALFVYWPFSKRWGVAR